MALKRTNLSPPQTLRPPLVPSIVDAIGPYIAVLKIYIDIFVGFFPCTAIPELQELSQKHSFPISEDCKFVDIGNNVMLKYSGSRRIAEWAHLVNACLLAGEGNIKSLLALAPEYAGRRVILILAGMTPEGSLARGEGTAKSNAIARSHKGLVAGLVAHAPLAAPLCGNDEGEMNMLTFSTGVNWHSAGEGLL